MTTEEGIVVKAGPHSAWVKTTKTSACESCSARSSCSTVGGGKEMEVEAINTAGALAGDRVVIGFKTSSLLKASFLLYVFPVLCLIIGAIIGQQIAPIFNFDASLLSAVVGFLFFGLALVFVKSKGNKLAQQNKYRPKIIRILKHP